MRLKNQIINMKKTIKTLSIGFALMTVFSCSHYIAPPFTDVGKISQLKPSMKIKQAIDLLGIEPYDIYHMQETGAQMLCFNYRLKNRIMYQYNTINYLEVQRLTTNEESQKGGDLYYDKKYRTIYIMFSKDGDLLSYLTTGGANNRGELVIIGNSIQFYDEKNINLIDSDYNKATKSYYNARPIEIGVNKDGTLNNIVPTVPTPKR
jgi:hypothetical protein